MAKKQYRWWFFACGKKSIFFFHQPIWKSPTQTAIGFISKTRLNQAFEPADIIKTAPNIGTIVQLEGYANLSLILITPNAKSNIPIKDIVLTTIKLFADPSFE